MSPTKAPNITS